MSLLKEKCLKGKNKNLLKTIKLSDPDLEIIGCTVHPLMESCYIPIKRLGQGSFGNVFQVCSPRSCDYIVKVEKIASISEFNNEVKISKIASNKGVAPKIYKSGICSDDTSDIYAYLLLQKLNKTLDHPSNYPYKAKPIKEALDLYYKLVKSGIFQRDLKANNIMLDTKGKVYIIDYNLGIIQKKLTKNQIAKHMNDMSQLLLHSLVGKYVNRFGEHDNWGNDKNQTRKYNQLVHVYKTIDDWLLSKHLKRDPGLSVSLSTGNLSPRLLKMYIKKEKLLRKRGLE